MCHCYNVQVMRKATSITVTLMRMKKLSFAMSESHANQFIPSTRINSIRYFVIRRALELFRHINLSIEIFF